MKRLLLMTLIAVGILSCQNNKKEVKETPSVKVEGMDNTEKIQNISGELKGLYTELLMFKDKSDFKTYGFGQGGPYHEWLAKVQDLKQNPDIQLSLKQGIAVAELEQLGLAYVGSKGNETEAIKILTKSISEAITSEPIETVKNASGNSNYDNLKSEYELFGKWTITNTTANSSYPYEIYTKDNEYVGIIPQGDFKIENLDKSGNKYSVRGNQYGEYYIITANKEMTLFDKDGELASMGYKAIKE